MKRRTLLTGALALPAIAACGQSETSAGSTVTVTQPGPTVTVTASYTGPVEGEPGTETPTSETSTASTTEPPVGSGVYKFGQAHTGASGSTVAVAAPKVFEPSYKPDEDVDQWVYCEITYLNKSNEPVDAASFSFRATTGDREAPTVIDSSQDVDGYPSATVLPGKQLKWKVGFGRDKGKEFIVAVDFNFQNVGFWR